MDGVGAVLSAEDRARYEAARKDLAQALTKKRAVDRQLANLEVQIFNFEGSYLTETAQHSGGNIIQGFDSYLKTQSVGRRRHEVTDADRVFSNSSLSYQKSLELLGEGDEHDADGAPESAGSRGPTPGITTVVLPAATQRNSQELSTAQQKKLRDKEYQRRKRALAAQEKAAAAAAAVEDGDDASSPSSSRRPSKKPRQADDD